MFAQSVITEHRLQHDFDWNNIQILDEEPYNKCLISQILNIKKQKNSFNLQTDKENLHKTYIEYYKQNLTLQYQDYFQSIIFSSVSVLS